MIKNIFILALAFCLAITLSSNKITEMSNYFIVHYTIGKNWKKPYEFLMQPHAIAHTNHLSALKNKGIIVFGMRYAEKGMICIKAKNLDDAKKIIESDSAVIMQTFSTEIQEASIFYDGCLSIESENEIPRAKGVGGIFFKAKDVKSLNEWYTKNLGFVPNADGIMFESRESIDPNKKAYLNWSPFNEKTKYFEPSKKEFMINYRVQNLEQLKINLEKNGVQIVDKIETYDYGKFLHIMDIEGNKIELWEPVDSEFTRSYQGKTTR